MAVVLRKHGAKKDLPDDRDCSRDYGFHILEEKCHVDLRKHVKRVYDQGSIGSSTATAVCSAYALSLATSSKEGHFDPSPLFLYYNARERDGKTWEDAGGSLRDTIKALNRQGVCKESEWPYEEKSFKERPPHASYVAAESIFKRAWYYRLKQDLNHLQACLAKDKCPFVFVFKVLRSFHETQSKGVMPVPTAGLHAVVAVGVFKKYFIILNSWGNKWGDKGYFYMPFEVILDKNMCFDFWMISTGYLKELVRDSDSD